MKPRMDSNTSQPTVVGVDIGKDVFHPLSGSVPVERLRSGGGSDASASKTLSRSFRRALSAWKPA
jgi:hypothetical protein